MGHFSTIGPQQNFPIKATIAPPHRFPQQAWILTQDKRYFVLSVISRSQTCLKQHLLWANPSSHNFGVLVKTGCKFKRTFSIKWKVAVHREVCWLLVHITCLIVASSCLPNGNQNNTLAKYLKGYIRRKNCEKSKFSSHRQPEYNYKWSHKWGVPLIRLFFQRIIQWCMQRFIPRIFALLKFGFISQDFLTSETINCSSNLFQCTST